MLLHFFWLLPVTFLGPFIGLLIGYMAKEELKDGRKYYNLIRLALIIALLAAFFFYFPQQSISILLFIIFLIILINKRYQKDSLIYALFGIMHYLSLISQELLAVTTSLIFLYGLPSGSLFLEEHIRGKNKVWLIKKAFFNYWIYLAVAIILYLLF